MDGELEGTGQNAVVTFYKVLCQHLSVRTEEYHRNCGENKKYRDGESNWVRPKNISQHRFADPHFCRLCFSFQHCVM
jgi:hypothetical protein